MFAFISFTQFKVASDYVSQGCQVAVLPMWMITRLSQSFFVTVCLSVVCEDRLRNDLYCVGWGVKLYSVQSIQSLSSLLPLPFLSLSPLCSLRPSPFSSLLLPVNRKDCTLFVFREVFSTLSLTVLSYCVFICIVNCLLLDE